MTLSEYILVSVLSSGAVIGILAFIIKKWMENFLKLQSDKQLEKLKASLQVKTAISEKVLKRYFTGVFSMAEVIHRCRNHSRNIAASITGEKLINADDLGELIENTSKITDYLYRYGLLLKEPYFDGIHVYKRTLHRMVDVMDAFLTAYSIEEKEREGKAFLAHQEKLEGLYKEVRHLMKTDPRLNTILDEK